MHCPKCKSHKISRSHSKGLEKIFRWLGRKLYHCEECGTRFPRWKITLSGFWLYFAAFVSCLLLFLIVLAFLFWLIRYQ